MKRTLTFLMKASFVGFFLSVPTFIVGNAHGKPECTLLAAADRSRSTATAAVPPATLAEGFESAAFPPPGWTTKSAGLPRPHAWHRPADTDDVGFGYESQLLSAVNCNADRHHASTNPWNVVTLREPWAADVPFETKTDYLRSSSDRNYVPGPDSLVARVSIVARRGYVEIVDVVTGESRRLLETPASLPQWSPDGRCLSCVVWKSQLNPYQLTVVDVATSKIVIEGDLTDASESKWSPDSRAIGVSGFSRKSKGFLLYTITVPDGRVTVIDSLKVLASHEFSWSPDSRWIAFSRPTRLHHYGDATAADLWIADVVTGDSWCILDGSEWAVVDPLWITSRSIQITRVRWHDEGANDEQRLVVELSHAADSPGQ